MVQSGVTWYLCCSRSISSHHAGRTDRDWQKCRDFCFFLLLWEWNYRWLINYLIPYSSFCVCSCHLQSLYPYDWQRGNDLGIRRRCSTCLLKRRREKCHICILSYCWRDYLKIYFLENLMYTIMIFKSVHTVCLWSIKLLCWNLWRLSCLEWLIWKWNTDTGKATNKTNQI